MRTIQLQRNFVVANNMYRLRLTVTAATGVTPQLFLYLQLPLIPGETENTGEFQGVCSPADLSEFPAFEPLQSADPPWFRHDTVDLLCRSVDEGMAAQLEIVQQLHQLLRALHELDQFGESEILVVEGP